METFYVLILIFAVNHGPNPGSFSYPDLASFPTLAACEAMASYHREVIPKDLHPVTHRCIEVSGAFAERT